MRKIWIGEKIFFLKKSVIMRFRPSLGLGLWLVEMCVNCSLVSWGASVFELPIFLLKVFEKKFEIFKKRVFACSRARGAHTHRAWGTQLVPLDSPYPK